MILLDALFAAAFVALALPFVVVGCILYIVLVLILSALSLGALLFTAWLCGICMFILFVFPAKAPRTKQEPTP